MALPTGFEPPVPKGSAERVARRGDQNAGAAGLAPHSGIYRTRLGAVVISGQKLALADPELTIEQVQLLDSSVPVRGIGDPRREPNEHAHTVLFVVRREQLALDARRNLLPLGLCPALRRGEPRLAG